MNSSVFYFTPASRQCNTGYWLAGMNKPQSYAENARCKRLFVLAMLNTIRGHMIVDAL